MLEKLVLVVYLLTSRNDVSVQYVVRYPTEAQCFAAAKKYDSTAFLLPYPVKRAECVFDITAPDKKGK